MYTGKDVPTETQEGEDKAQANAVPHVTFYCPDYEADMRKGGKYTHIHTLYVHCFVLFHSIDYCYHDYKRLQMSNHHS